MKPKSNYKSGIFNPNGIDNCQTPEYAMPPLLKYVPKNYKVWECACGEGLMFEYLQKEGYQSFGTDIQSGVNFFEPNTFEYDCIITNPPFGLKFDWIKRCYELGKPWALLLPVETLGAKKAQILFKQYGMQLVLMDKRINFKMPNKGWDSSAQFPTAWFTWNIGVPKDIVYEEIPR